MVCLTSFKNMHADFKVFMIFSINEMLIDIKHDVIQVINHHKSSTLKIRCIYGHILREVHLRRIYEYLHGQIPLTSTIVKYDNGIVISNQEVQRYVNAYRYLDTAHDMTISIDMIAPVEDAVFSGPQSQQVLSYQVDNNICQVNIYPSTYVIELELLQIDRLDTFFDLLERFFKCIYETEYVYTLAERDTVKIQVDNLTEMQTYIQQIPKTLHWEDLTVNGIINNKYTYAMQHKPVGRKGLLACLDTGIWLIHDKDTYNKISPFVDSDIVGTVFIVYNVPSTYREAEYKYFLMVADCISLDRDKLTEDMYTRMMTCQDIVKTIMEASSGHILSLKTMKFRSFDTAEQLYAGCRELFNERGLLEYKQDGIIFTAFNTLPWLLPIYVWSQEISLYLMVKPDDHSLWALQQSEVIFPVKESIIMNKLFKYTPGNILTFYYDIQDDAWHSSGIAAENQPMTYDEAYKKYEQRTSQARTYFNFRLSRVSPVQLSVLKDAYVEVHLNIVQGQSLVQRLTTESVIHFKYMNNQEIRALDIMDKPSDFTTVMRDIEYATNPITEMTLRGENMNLIDRACQDLLISLPANKFIIRNIHDISANIWPTIVIYRCYYEILTHNLIRKVMDMLSPSGTLIIIDLDADALRHLFRPAIRGANVDFIVYGPLRLTYLTQPERVIEIANDKVEERIMPLISLNKLLEYNFALVHVSQIDPKNRQLFHDTASVYADMHSMVTLRLIHKDKINITVSLPENPHSNLPEIAVACAVCPQAMIMIACPDDAWSLMHAILKASTKIYQESNDEKRRDIARRIFTLITDSKKDTYTAICNALQINLIIMAGIPSNIYVKRIYVNNKGPVIIVHENNGKYNLIGVKMTQGSQTTFTLEIPFIQQLIK